MNFVFLFFLFFCLDTKEPKNQERLMLIMTQNPRLVSKGTLPALALSECVQLAVYKMGLALDFAGGVPTWRRRRKNKILFERSELILFSRRDFSGSPRSQSLNFCYFWFKPKVENSRDFKERLNRTKG